MDFVKEAAAPDKDETTKGLIPAEELPSAANALAELFPEDPAPPMGQPESVEAAIGIPRDPAPRPKRRNIFLRLFSPKQPSTVQEEPSAPVDANGKGEFKESARKSSTSQASAVQAPAESSAVRISKVATPAATPIAASDLPSAAHTLAELFPPEAAEAVSEPADGESEDLLNAADIEAAVESLSPGAPVSIQASAEAVIPPATELADASISAVPELEASVPEPPVEEARAETPEEKSIAPNEAHPDETRHSPSSLNTENTDDSREQELVEKLDEKNAGQPEETPTESPTPKPYKNWAFDDKLASHKEWIDSHGLGGKRADLAGANLEAADLISVNLRLADLHDANLRAADLLLADLRDACLVRADLEDACLVGANLEAANLEGASLETAMGLVPRQIAGANLRDALLPPQLMEFEAETAFSQSARRARTYFKAITGASILSWLMIWRTRDIQLVTDSSIFSFWHSRAAAAALPTAELYLIFPVALLTLYVLLHFQLLRMWDSVQELPAIFPDGRTLGDDQPGVITGLLRAHFRWMNPEPSTSNVTERSLWQLAAYWVTPLTLLLFWARYLTRQEIHGTLLQALLAATATGIAFYATTRVGRPQEKWAVEWRQARRVMEKIKGINPMKLAGVLAFILILLSAGTIDGVPHEHSRAPQYNVASIRRWAPTVFWSLGLDPYADLTEAAISRHPSGWNIPDDQISSFDGARLNNLKMRYAQAYAAFLAGAHLWHADLQGSFLSQADLRGADLGQSNLRYALMDQARLYHANLDRSHLDGADLRRADLHEANLSYCFLTNAILADARLDGANLYTSDLNFATLVRANIEKADLRNASLSNAHMDHADLRGAYLWSSRLMGADLGSAQLGNAIFIDANLEGANLGGAQFSGTVLNGANLHGASLEGADLRDASGLTANQVCSVKSRRGALLNDDLEMQVEAQCGRAQ
ncbi:MAG TPA: pentapeptide repeat-containing protein [Candidatus Acidoferrales bacterium]